MVAGLPASTYLSRNLSKQVTCYLNPGCSAAKPRGLMADHPLLASAPWTHHR